MRETLKRLEGGECVEIELRAAGVSGAAAIARVIEKQRRNAVCGEKLLHGKPMLNGFADAVAEKHCGSCRVCGGLNEHRIEKIPAAGNLQWRRRQAGRVAGAGADPLAIRTRQGSRQQTRLPRHARLVGDATEDFQRQESSRCGVRSAHRKPCTSRNASLPRHRRNRSALVSRAAASRRNRRFVAAFRLLGLWPQHRTPQRRAIRSRRTLRLQNASASHAPAANRHPWFFSWQRCRRRNREYGPRPITFFSAPRSRLFAMPFAPSGSLPDSALSFRPYGRRKSPSAIAVSLYWSSTAKTIASFPFKWRAISPPVAPYPVKS